MFVCCGLPLLLSGSSIAFFSTATGRPTFAYVATAAVAMLLAVEVVVRRRVNYMLRAKLVEMRSANEA